MAHLYKKTINGRAYWYLRETYRDGKKVRVKWQKYLGTPDTILKRLERAENSSPVKLGSQEYGSVFIADSLERMIGTIQLVDSIVPRSPREKGPSIGEYFFYAWANRLIDPASKNSMGRWYERTAIQHLRNVRTDELNSARFWEKWDRVSEEHIQQIGEAFFSRIRELQGSSPDCFLLDTTNYYSYMAAGTDSELFKRGHNKAGKHYLRQVGLALLVDRKNKLPLYYRPYEGNEHDSQIFNRIIDEMFGIVCGFNNTKERLTVVFDKGMNSVDNVEFIDDHQRIHFVTTYSPHYAQELAGADLSEFRPLDLPGNRELIEVGKEQEQILGYRSNIHLWGKERTIVITHNPRTMRKKERRFLEKLEKIREHLIEFRRKFRERKAHWKKFDTIVKRYHALCGSLHISSKYYDLELSKDGRELSFRKNAYQARKTMALFGRNLIVTDNSDWTTEMIVESSLDRYIVEQRFRDSKSPHHISVNPIYHWTDSKIRCHLLVCVIALTMKRLLEIKMDQAGHKLSAERTIEEMRDLDLITCWMPGKKKPTLHIEDPNKIQNVVLKVFGVDSRDGWVLQN